MNLLEAHDLRLSFDDTANRLSCFDARGAVLLRCEMRNSTVNDGSFGHFGNCPRGTYALGAPQDRHAVPFGFHFTPLLGVPGRGGIGIHGGGSGLQDPFAPHQGWQVTEGCLRVQNADNERLVHLIRAAQAAGGRCTITVTGEAA